ncbi:response regulator [Shewanella algicola]|uniref:response regulator n=1 Tax=Shewanella algicola TaxID=640633 RepID=UPI002494BED3|nr:response regulator [Shewanella algicola]
MSTEKLAKVLIIDDEHSSIEVMTTMLESTMTVYVAETAEEGYNLLQLHDIDIILLDVDLPDLSGFDLCKKIKSEQSFADIPVIFISGYKDLIFEIQAFEAGGIDYLTKPISPIKMLIRMSVALKIKLPIPNAKSIRLG